MLSQFSKQRNYLSVYLLIMCHSIELKFILLTFDSNSARPSKLTAKIIIAGIWLLAGSLATPMAIARRVIMEPENSICKFLQGFFFFFVNYTFTTAIFLKFSFQTFNRLFLQFPAGSDNYKPFCKHVNLSDKSMLIYSGLLVFLQYLTPLSIISCVYARMALKLWGNKAPGNAEDSRDANLMRNKMKVYTQYDLCN